MKLYKRMLLSADRVDYQRTVTAYERLRAEIPLDIAIRNAGHFSELSSETFLFGFIALESYLAEAYDVTYEYARRCLDAVQEYWFGRWKEEIPSGQREELPPNREYWDRICRWQQHWLNCLLWCSVLGEWDRLLDFAGYLRDDVMIDVEQSKENRAWLLLVAGRLRGRPVEELQPFSETILNGRRKREKLLWDVFNDILEEAPEDASASLARYATYHRTAEFPKPELNLKVAYDASFLVHYAEFIDMPITIPPKLMDHIVRLP